MKTIFLFIGLLFLLSGCSNIESPAKAFHILDDGNVYLEGRWKEIAETSRYKMIPKHNSISILCDKKAGVCTETQALLVIKKDNPLIPSALLYPEQFTYLVTEWSDATIKAERKPRAADVEIRISLTDKSAEKSYRETKARGADSSNPDVVGNWILR
jgi:hypothetical protein